MATVTAADIYEQVARILGGRVGLLGTVTVDNPTGYTTAVLIGLKNTTGNQQSYASQLLFYTGTDGLLYDSFVKEWNDATGLATFLNGTVNPDPGERYILVPAEDYTLNEYRLALNKALSYTRRTYRQVVPLTPNLQLYPLVTMPWLEGAGDIDAAWLSTSPVMLHDEDFSLWSNGAHDPPDGYTLTDLGTGATIERQLGGMRSAYKAHIEAGSGIVRLTQPVPDSLVAWASGRTQTAPVRYPMRPWAWASTPDANAVRAFVFDGTTYHYTDYFDASSTGLPIFKEAQYVPSTTDTEYTWGVEIAAGAEADVHVAGLVQNTQTVTLTYSLKQQGSQAFREVQIPLNERNVGGLPTIELPNWPGAWYQLIVYARRTFPSMALDTDELEAQYAKGIVAGTTRWLLDANKPQQDRVRLDKIMAQQGKDWSRFTQNFVSVPVPTPLTMTQIYGA